MRTRLLTCLTIFSIIVVSQPVIAGQGQWTFDAKRQWLLENDPAFAEAVTVNETRIRRHLRLRQFDANEILTVPVVVHVIHNGETAGVGTNISDAQVQSAIVAMNNHFKNLAPTHTNYQDSNIRFALAVRDPDDQPHSGINRVDGTGVTGYSADVNANGAIDLTDIILALMVLVGQTPDGVSSANADIDGNGKLGITDVIYILRQVVGIQ